MSEQEREEFFFASCAASLHCHVKDCKARNKYELVLKSDIKGGGNKGLAYRDTIYTMQLCEKHKNMLDIIFKNRLTMEDFIKMYKSGELRYQRGNGKRESRGSV